MSVDQERSTGDEEIESEGDGRLSGAEGNGGAAAGPLHVKAFPYLVHYSSSFSSSNLNPPIPST